jgi:hypothetical protein
MSDELKACPFCGCTDITFSPYTEKITHSTFVKCEHCRTGWMPVNIWNTRPLEDALQARVDTLQKRLVELAALTDVLASCVKYGWGDPGAIDRFHEWQGRCMAEDAIDVAMKGGEE